MNIPTYHRLNDEVKAANARLIAVSKTYPPEAITTLYQAGQRLFGENKVQEMMDKYEVLPKDIEWHLIGHLQRNKVKYIAPFVSLIHAVDSYQLLYEIHQQGVKYNRVIDCLLQIHIAQEETKYGLSEVELIHVLTHPDVESFSHIRICGLMGMATNTDNTGIVEQEFAGLKEIFDTVKAKYFTQKSYFKELSMGMSSDYSIALHHGATMIRVGSAIFGARD